MPKKNLKSGFTLIELLVVMAIIGLLATVVLISLDDARAGARDAERKSDLRSMKIALELFYQKRGSYTQPESCCVDTSNGATCCGTNNIGDWTANSDLRDLVSQGYLPELPKDPINNTVYKYSYEPSNAGEHGFAASGQAYILCAVMETSASSYCVGANWPGVPN